jgi:8-amino-7-oxononanoate synthase
MRKSHAPYTQFCSDLRSQHLLRHLPKDASYLYDFSTNDYLGFSKHPLLAEAAIMAADSLGVGNIASRVISTKQKALNDLEYAIAQAKNTQNALVFATGYQANISVLSALLDIKVLKIPPLVFSDRLNHASMHIGCQIAKAKQYRYHHLDYDHLQFFLKNARDSKQPKFILSESVFGMDGDVADIAKLIQLAKDHHAIIYLDEAHATGLFGKKGYGLSADFKGVDISMGTFSKALGTNGAYIAVSHALKRYFINRCSGLIYSTALSPVQVATMQKAWELVEDSQIKVKQLFQNATWLRTQLQERGYQIGNATTHIIPLILQCPAKTMAIQQTLAQKGIKVSAIRPPTVGAKLSRLRIALNVHHTIWDLKVLLQALDQCLFLK